MQTLSDLGAVAPGNPQADHWRAALGQLDKE
jgi:hypothetical protein